LSKIRPEGLKFNLAEKKNKCNIFKKKNSRIFQKIFFSHQKLDKKIHFDPNFKKNSKKFRKISKNFEIFQKISKKFQRISKNLQRISKNFKNFEEFQKNFEKFQKF